MTLEQQVCSLELAKRLKELGVKQESLLWWVKNTRNDDRYEVRRNALALDSLTLQGPTYAAFTVAELGEMLWKQASPEDILKAYGEVWNVRDTRYITPEGLVRCMEDPTIGATMLIYLIENKLITLP